MMPRLTEDRIEIKPKMWLEAKVLNAISRSWDLVLKGTRSY